MSPPMRTTRDIRRPAGSYCKSVTLAAASVLMAACGQSAPDASSTHAMHQGSSGAQNLSNSGAGLDPELVSAVSAAGNSTTPISMKFKLANRPMVTTPLQLLVSVMPSNDVPISHIRVSFQPGEGLQLQSERILEVSNPTPGSPIQRELTLVPQQKGVLSLSATVLVDTETGSISRTYWIPLIATDSRS
jgi:hypothetical protein